MLRINVDEHTRNYSTQPHVQLDAYVLAMSALRNAPPDVHRYDRYAFGSRNGGYGQYRGGGCGWRGKAKVIGEPFVLLISASHTRRLELIVLAGCGDLLLEKHGAPDDLVGLVTGMLDTNTAFHTCVSIICLSLAMITGLVSSP